MHLANEVPCQNITGLSTGKQCNVWSDVKQLWKSITQWWIINQHYNLFLDKLLIKALISMLLGSVKLHLIQSVHKVQGELISIHTEIFVDNLNVFCMF